VTAQEFSDNYIVRIYRRSGQNFGQLVGIVEEIGITHTDKRPFTSMEELWDIIARRQTQGSRREGPKGEK